MSRKFKIGGSSKSLKQLFQEKINAAAASNTTATYGNWGNVSGLSSASADSYKNYSFKINKKGEMEPILSDAEVTADDITFSASKSNLRRIADLERNVSILANRISTIDSEATNISDDNAFDNWITEDTAFTKDVTLGVEGSTTSWWGGSSSYTTRVDVDGHLYINNGITFGSTALEELQDKVGAMFSGTETGISVTYDDNSGTATFSVSSAPKWSNGRKITLGGDLSGNVTIDGSSDVTLTATISDDSHNHVISNIDGLQDALDAKAATTYVDAQIAALVDTAPTTLNTLNELAAALGDDASFSTTVTNSIATKLPLAGGTMTGAINMGGYDITNAGTFYGVSTTAKYADLAERYAADAPYSEGTVVVFGGEAEVTASTSFAQRSIAGVVSTKPAVMMNAEAGNSQTHPFIALQGRVPVKVTGEVKKGDILVASDIAGTATAWTNDDADPRMTAYVGIAIADAVDGFVEVKVGK